MAGRSTSFLGGALNFAPFYPPTSSTVLPGGPTPPTSAPSSCLLLPPPTYLRLLSTRPHHDDDDQQTLLPPPRPNHRVARVLLSAYPANPETSIGRLGDGAEQHWRRQENDERRRRISQCPHRLPFKLHAEDRGILYYRGGW